MNAVVVDVEPWPRTGRTNRKSIPRNPLHLAVLLERSDMRLPGVYAVAHQPLKILAGAARRLGVGTALERRYLTGD